MGAGSRGPKKSAFVLTNNIFCEINSMLMSRYDKYLVENGIPVVASQDEADVVVLVGCGFDKTNDDQFSTWVKETASQLKSEQELLVAGCWPGMHPDQIPAGVKITPMPLWEQNKLDKVFGANRPFDEITINRLPSTLINAYSGLFTPGNQGDYYISVSRGCANACSYCLIRKGKGPLTSEPLEKITRQYVAGLREGCTSFVLVSDDFGSYGRDLGITGPDLIQHLHGVDPRGRFIINYLFPAAFLRQWEGYRTLFALGIVTAANIPVQSFSQRILGLMNRNYHAKELRGRLRELKGIAPTARLVTHCIVGFPTETEEDFLQTVVNATSLFDQVTFFEYGDREGVRSNSITPKVTETELRERTLCLRLMASLFPSRVLFKPGDTGAMPLLPNLGGDDYEPALFELGKEKSPELPPPGSPPVNQASPALPSQEHAAPESSTGASVDWPERVVSHRRFTFATVALESALRSQASNKESKLYGLRVDRVYPIQVESEFGIAIVMTGR